MKSCFVRLMIASTGALAGHAALAALPPPLPPPPKPTAVKPAPAPAPAVPVSAIAQYLNVDISAPAKYATVTLPAYYDAQLLRSDNTPPNNRITDKGATLGRVLFWDKRLSVNDTVACATCHQPANGFSATTRFSKGFSGATGTAHAMGLANIAFYRAGTMFWDKRTASVEAQATQPITNPIEMGYDASNGGIGCAGCHQPPTFALNPNSLSNGLDAGETRVFKSPSLKSLSPGQPMMHDGRFTTYEQVVSFYNLGVKNGPALDNRLKTPRGDARVPNLPSADQAALVAFLKTLDDPTLRIDTRLGNPFKQ